MAQAYAVIEGGEINIRSISPSRAGAMINWLVSEKGMSPYGQTLEDGVIEKVFEKMRGSAECEPIHVERMMQ